MVTGAGQPSQVNNTMRRTYVIGDIHGCCDCLNDLLGRITPDPIQDRIVFLGDYIDRGPQSKQVIDVLLALKRRHGRTIFLKGNHEDALLQYLAGGMKRFYLEIGGRETLLSYGCQEPFEACQTCIPDSHLEFFYDLMPYFEDEATLFVHAGLKAGLHLTQQPPEWLYWVERERFMKQHYDFGKRVVFGHTVVAEPTALTPDRIAIDTGAVYGGALTCLILPDLECVSVPCPKYWQE